MFSVELLLSARLFLHPRLLGNRLFFLSNLGQGGHLSLYAMDYGGSVPEPLLPPQIALQNPELIGGSSFEIFPKLGKIMVMLDHNGDENYQPNFIPLEGGVPEPLFPETFSHYRLACAHVDTENNMAYFSGDAHDEQMYVSFRANLETGRLDKLGQSKWGMYPDGVSKDNREVILVEGYTMGDNVMYRWTEDQPEAKLLAGIPLEKRTPDQHVPLSSFGHAYYTAGNKGLLFYTSLFSDTYGLGYLEPDNPQEVRPVNITGIQHSGAGELYSLKHIKGNVYSVGYNIDGCSWLYEGQFDEAALEMRLNRIIVGQGELSNGVLENAYYDEDSDRYALSFCTATSPSQIYTVEGSDRQKIVKHTRERILGIPQELLSPGEDASFISHDGLRVSARLYLPAPSLGYEGARPLVYYIHGGPQGQERPDFTWFSMPLIQFLTLNGFAVFVPNARGSTGYGLSYTKKVDRDWGGNDRLDHVHAMTQVLPKDSRVDVKRAGVIGRSYGGYMTLTQATRHPDLWAAAIDMFGPYDLNSFTERVPESWKPYFALAIGDPVKDRDFLTERSPRTYVQQLTCPLMVIQGQNDPRVIERESRDVVENLREQGKEVDYLVFADEGHDVLKFANRVRCYNTIMEFFKKHLQG
ncbi:MAG TPA: prolyl oligopeptidase family serine peptidase [Chloroflexia bacterium]|nr:prolyl oligopeptidase family serine peptidase [Chloroflexia bacterium]